MKRAAIRAATLTVLGLLPTALVWVPAASAPPTYAREVSRILEKHCTGCHRTGSVGPFPLTNYAEARAFASEIRRATQSRRMPPWSAAPGPVEFQNQRLLSVEEIKTLGEWFDSGAALGNLKELIPPAPPNNEWAYGPPDALLMPKRPYQVVGSFGEEVRCFLLSSGVPVSEAIRAIDVQPGDGNAVYQVRAFAEASGLARRLNGREPRAGFDCSLNMESVLTRNLLGEWEPGTPRPHLPPGIGRRLNQGADIMLEVHYHGTYRPVSDQTRVALYFLREAPTTYVKTVAIVNREFRIPPGNSDHHVMAEWLCDEDILALSVTPHMHRLGAAVEISVLTPGGGERDLVRVNRYNVNWQTAYVFKEPIMIPKGTLVRVNSSYDNSYQNMNLNPRDPLRESRWGNGPEDEMMSAFLEYVEPKAVNLIARAN